MLTRMVLVAAAVMFLAGNASISPFQEGFKALTNYPNPFDSRLGSTTILFTLESDSEVSARIYDLFGVHHIHYCRYFNQYSGLSPARSNTRYHAQRTLSRRNERPVVKAFGSPGQGCRAWSRGLCG